MARRHENRSADEDETAAQGGPSAARVFISYRRGDVPGSERGGHARHLYGELERRFGRDNVFIDIDTLEPGRPWQEVIDSYLARCDVLLVLIGADWLAIQDDGGRRRLDDANDVHRREIESALSRDLRVIPILIEDANAPSTNQLPASVATLADIQAARLSHRYWQYQVPDLVQMLERIAAPTVLAAQTEQKPSDRELEHVLDRPVVEADPIDAADLRDAARYQVGSLASSGDPFASRTTDEPLKVFISYRRDDSKEHAGRLFDALAERFGDEYVFMDVDTMLLRNNIRVLEGAVGLSDVLIAVIGRYWATITDSAGRRRLDDPEDFVRVEIRAALERDVRVIPAFVNGAQMPYPDQLPADLAGLAHWNGIAISDHDWRAGVERLMLRLDDLARQKAAGQR